MKVRRKSPEKGGVLELEIKQGYMVLRRFYKVGSGYRSNGQTLTVFADEKDWLIEQLATHQNEPTTEVPK